LIVALNPGQALGMHGSKINVPPERRRLSRPSMEHPILAGVDPAS